MAENALPDAAARRRAATDFETNLVVLAGAGTGKTSLLVERALNAIGTGVAGMQRIGAITFTEKAAGEMRERLARGLDQLRALARGEIDPDEGEEAGRAFSWQERQVEYCPEKTAERALAAMEQIDGGTVTTIHGFCGELLRSFPVQAGVDPGFVVDNGERTDLLLRSAWDAFVGRELGAAPPRPEIWRKILSRVPFEGVARLARESSGFGIPDALLQPPWPGAAAPELLASLADDLATRVADLLERQADLSAAPLSYLHNSRDALRVLGADGSVAFRNHLARHPEFQDQIEKKKTPSVNKKPSPEQQLEAKQLIGEAGQLLPLAFKTDDALVRALLEAVSPFAEEFREQCLRRGFVSFDGLLSLARDLLRDHPAIRARLKRKYRLLLIDEFQDTDPLQYEIVLFLAEVADETAAEAYDARPAPGRLFVVGDAKQSIYRFRGADYTAYSRAVSRIVDNGGRQLDLVSNFRSVPEVTEPVNLLFSGASACWHESGHQPRYVPIEAVRKRAGDTPRVELWTVRLPADAGGAGLGRAAEGKLIAEAIERWVREGRHRYREITILFRAMTGADLYLGPLRDRGIPFVVEGARDFLDRPEVAQLMATFETLAQPSNQPALLAFLRSPAGAVTDVELAAYAAGGAEWNWSAVADAEHFPGIARCFDLLRDLDRQTRELPADAAVRRVLDRTLMLPLGAAAFEGAQRVANLQKLTDAVGELARDGRLSLEEVVAALREGKLEQVKTGRPLADDAADAVRIATVHGMKGLENDCVIVPDLARERAGNHNEPAVALTVLPDGKHALAIEVAGTLNSPRVWRELEERRHEEAEEVRVLYVALTRAKERLVLLARGGRRKAGWIDALAPWGYEVKNVPEDEALIAEGRVLHRLLDPPERPRHEPVDRSEQAPQAVRAYESAVTALREGSFPPFAAPSTAAGGGEAAHGGTAGTARDRGVGLAVGRVLHRLLESWDGQDDAWFERRLALLAGEEARDRELEPAAVERESKTIAEAFLAGDLARRFKERTRLGTEVPLLLRRDPRGQYRGSIDLLYEDDDGAIVVADYKTDDETDRDALVRRYGPQIRVYVEAVRRALDLEAPPRGELWMLRSGERIPIE